MAYADRVKETTTTTGTGALTLAGAATGFRTFAAGFTVGATMPYAISDALGNWEIGTGTLSASSTLARTTVLASSNANALVSFPAGSKDVFCTPNAAAFAAFASATDATTATIANVATSKILIEEGGVTKRISMADFLAALGTTAGGLPAAATLTGADIIAVSQDGGATQVRTTLSAVQAFIGVADTTAPTISSAAVANATPTIVTLAASEPLNASFTPAASAFTVSGHTVSAVSISGSTINLTVSAFVNGEAARTVAYTQPGTNNARDAAGNLLANFSGLAITNNVQPVADTTAPTFVSAQVANAAPTIIVLTMSETLAATLPAASAFTVSGGKAVSSVSISGATVSLTCSAAYVNGDTITVTYTKPGSGNMLQDAAGNTVATFGPSALTNNVAAAGGPDYRTTVGPFNPPQAGNISSNGYYGTGSEMFIKSPTNQTPANVYLAWSKSSTVAPTTTTNPQGNAYVLAGRVGNWTQGGSPSQSYYGLYGAPSTLYAYGTAGTWYLWIITDDGVAKPYDNNTGTPIGFTFT